MDSRKAHICNINWEPCLLFQEIGVNRHFKKHSVSKCDMLRNLHTHADLVTQILKRTILMGHYNSPYGIFIWMNNLICRIFLQFLDQEYMVPNGCCICVPCVSPCSARNEWLLGNWGRRTELKSTYAPTLQIVQLRRCKQSELCPWNWWIAMNWHCQQWWKHGSQVRNHWAWWSLPLLCGVWRKNHGSGGKR